MDRWLKTGNLCTKRSLEVEEDAEKNELEEAVKRNKNTVGTSNASTISKRADILINSSPEKMNDQDSKFEVWNDSKYIQFKEKYPWLSISKGTWRKNKIKLKKQANKCNFGLNIEEHLRDKFIAGVSNQVILKRLLQEPELTFNMAVNIATTIESVDCNVLKMKSYAETKEINKLHSKCKHCGKMNHHSDRCFFRNSFCYSCKQLGHISTVCHSKSKNGYFQPRKSEASAHGESFSGKNGESINNIEYLTNKFESILYVFDIKFLAEIDTGAALTTMSKDLFLKYFEHVKLFPSKCYLTDYQGKGISSIGECKVKVRYKNKIGHLNLIVTNIENNKFLIGKDWIVYFDMVQINVQQNNNFDTNFIFNKYYKLFEDIVLPIKDISVHINVKNNFAPKFYKFRPAPFAIRNLIEEELLFLLNNDIIENIVDSPIASPLVCVPKKNGKIRICADFKRTLNPFIEDVKYPIPNIDNVLHSFFGKSIFSKIDLSSAYHQILQDEESQKLTVISTHKGLFKYKRLPFGIKSGATIFQRTMDNIFSGLKNVIIYLDDILIASSDVNEHISDIETVMNKLSDFNFSINKEKSLFFVDEINYLGHRINKNGIYPLEDKLDSIKKCPKPSNISELKSFLGMLSFYSKFVRNLSIHANPLFSLLKRSYNWNWKNEHDQAFEKCKNLISTKTCLTHYSQDLPLYVTCDASNYGIGGYISHIVNGTEKPITFVSRTLNDTEKKYSQIEKEGLSIFFTLNRLKQFLYGRKFIINTDHKPLLAIFGDKNNLPALVANRLHRWSLSISNFNFEIKYTKGTEIPLADFLSRFPNPEKGEKEEEMGEILLIENSILDYVLVSYKTQEDPTLRKLYKLVKYDKYDVDSEVDIKPYNRIKNEITIVRNCLFFGNRMIIPDSLREYVLKIIHENHIGVNKMKTLARSSVYWPGMDEQIEKLSKSCSTCMENTSKLPKQEFTEWTPPNKVWKRIHLDYFYFAGKTFLILVDAHSNWIECQMVPNTSAGFCIDFLRECLARYGIPEVAVMDNGPPFRSYEIKTFFERNGIHAMFSPAYHPESNGLAEVSVREIKKTMKRIISEERELPLEFALIKALYAYRLSPLTRTEKSPAGIFLNREIRTKISMLSKKSVRVGRLKNKKQNNSYKINDRVRYRWMERGKPKWMFGIVKRIVGSNSCMIETDGIERKVHTNYMRRSMERKDVSSSEEGISYPRPQTSSPLTPATIVAESTPGPPTESTPSRRYPLRERRPPDRYQNNNNIAKTNRPYSDYENHITLQTLNGIKLGSTLHSRYSATQIINHIACEMRKMLVAKILSTNSKITILIDESTTLSNKSTLVIFLKAYLGGESIDYIFFDLCELQCQDSENIEKELLNTLYKHGLNEEYLKENWIAIATDGAGVMVGRHSGVVTRLKQKFPKLFAWHCLNHRLELSVGDTIKEVRGINHFKAFMDKLYSLYSQSPKNCRALEEACHELGTRFAKVGRILGVRWISSSFRTIKTVWESYESLHHHFKSSTYLDSTYQGLLRRLESPEFILDLGLMKALGAAVGTFGGALVSNGWAGSAFMAVFTAVEALRSSGALGRVVAEATTAEADAGADGLLEVEDYSIHHDPPANAQGSKGLEVHLDEGGAGPVSGCRTVRHAHHLVPRKFSNSSGFQEGLLNCGVGCLLIHFEEADPWQDLLLLADLHSIQLAGQGGCNLRDGVRIAGMEDQLPLGVARPLLSCRASEILGLVRRINIVEDHAPTKLDPMLKFPKLFTGLGKIDIPYGIKLKEGAKPFSIYTPRRVPIPLMKELQMEMERMTSNGVIEKVEGSSKWCSPMVLVAKPSGKLRICVDLSILNQNSLRGIHPIPVVEHTLAQLKGAKLFTKLDANRGFWQIPLSSESSALTTFITPFGRFRFKRLPFGISSAPEIFQKRMGQILEGLEGTLCHMDDSLVYGSCQEEHDKILETVLTRLSKAGLTLNKDKCKFAVTTIKFLGHQIDPNGIQVDPKRKRGILEFSKPRSVKELKQFLEMVNFSARFVPNLAEISHPLNKLLSKKEEWIWEDDQDRAFDQKKKSLTSAQGLALYDPSLPITDSADASSFGLGAVIWQTKDGLRQVIAYASRTLSETEKRYVQIEKEALAITWACEKFKQYIQGLVITLETDHKPLVPIFTSKNIDDLTPRIQRLRLRIMRYSYKIVHTPGNYLIVADALSRSPRMKVGTQELEEELCAYVQQVVSFMPISDVRVKEIKESQDKDQVIQNIIKYTQEGWPERTNVSMSESQYWPAKDDFSVENGILLKGSRYVIPENIRKGYPEIARLEDMTSASLIVHCKSIFARHGIPLEVRSDNGPQFGSLFKEFAQDYGFTHVTSSPRYPQSNGFIESFEKIVKERIGKSKDPYLSLLAYRATPLANGFSPAELSMGRRIRTTIPTPTKQHQPPNLKNLKNQEAIQREKQKYYFDRAKGVRELPPLEVNDRVWLTDLKTSGVIISKADTPRSYMVDTPRGRVRRNRFHLLPTGRRSPGSPHFEPDEEPYINYPEANTHTSDAPMDVTDSSTSPKEALYRTRSGRI
ncbi:K02A2.6-like, partial [Cordylochernes scorpioides]